MAFSFEPFLAISAGHFMAVSAGPEHLMWISSKKIRCTIRLWSKRIYLNHTDRAQSIFWRGLVVCLKRMMIYDYSF